MWWLWVIVGIIALLILGKVFKALGILLKIVAWPLKTIKRILEFIFS